MDRSGAAGRKGVGRKEAGRKGVGRKEGGAEWRWVAEWMVGRWAGGMTHQ